MGDVRFVEVGDELTLADWQRVHNEIIPTDPLSLDQVRERSGRHRLELAYAGAPDRRLAFALARGFVEVERYLLPGDTVPYVALVLA